MKSNQKCSSHLSRCQIFFHQSHFKKARKRPKMRSCLEFKAFSVFMRMCLLCLPCVNSKLQCSMRNYRFCIRSFVIVASHSLFKTRISANQVSTWKPSCLIHVGWSHPNSKRGRLGCSDLLQARSPADHQFSWVKHGDEILPSFFKRDHNKSHYI